MLLLLFFIFSRSDNPTIEGDAIVFTNQDQFNLPSVTRDIISKKISKVIVKMGTITNLTSTPWFYLIRSLEIQTTSINSIPDYYFCNNYFIKKVTLSHTIKFIGQYAFNGSLIEEINLENVENFEKYSFAYTTNLHKVDLRSATKFVDYCFCNSGLYEINIPHSLASLPPYFAYSSFQLTTVTASSITTLYERAFGNCINLTNLHLVFDTLSTIGPQAFEFTNIKSFTFGIVLSSIGSGVFQYTPLEEITISESGLVNIGARCFSNTLLKKVTITSHLTEIKDNVFSSCSFLTEVNLPDSIKKIGEGAFSYCINLVTLNIPNVETISNKAFMGCSNLSLLDLPNVKSIGVKAFLGCTNVFFSGIEGREDQVTIVPLAFQDCDKINFKYLSQSMSDATFRYCKGLTKLRVSLVLVHHEKMFMGCTNLEEVVFTDDSTATKLNHWMFTGCTKLKSVVLAPSIKAIGEYAFFSTNLESIDLKNVNSIDFRAFSRSKLSKLIIKNDFAPNHQFADCFDLKTIVLGENVQDFTLRGFANCNVSNIEVQGTNYKFESGVLYDESKTVIVCVTNQDELFTIPQQITKICFGAFSSNTKVKKIMLNHWINFEGGEFANTHNLKTFVDQSNIDTLISDYMFCNCTSLESLSFASNILCIGEHSFTNCRKLKRVDKTDKTVSFGDYSFMNCISLQYINISSAVYIGQFAFYYCQNITECKFSELLRFIGRYAFSRSGIKEVTIRSTCNYIIQNHTFENCNQLKRLYYLMNANTLSSNHAWLYNTPLEYVYIGKDVILDGDFFQYIKSGVKIELHPDNPYYEIKGSALIDKKSGYARNVFTTDASTVQLPTGVENFQSCYMVKPGDLSDINPLIFTDRGPSTLKIPSDVKYMNDLVSSQDRFLFTICYDGDHYLDTIANIQPLRRFITNGDYPYPFAFNIPVEYGDCEVWSPVPNIPSDNTANNVFGLSRMQIFLIMVVVFVCTLLLAFIIFMIYKMRERCKKKKKAEKKRRRSEQTEQVDMRV